MDTLETRRLPRTGQVLTTLGMGCAPLGGLFDAVSETDARAAVDAAWAAGIRFFDTAPYYGYTLSEHRLGAALREHPRDGFCVSSKVGRLLVPLPPNAPPRGPRTGGDAWAAPLPFEPRYDYGAAALRRSVEDSLQRLGTNRLDIALVHDIGTVNHGAENARHWQALVDGGFRELEAMRREGVVGAIGLGVNEWPVIAAALEHVDLDCCLLAGRYTLLEQGALHPFLDTCGDRQVGVIVGGPFNSGVLAAAEPEQAHFDYDRVPAAVAERVRALGRVCRAHGVPLPAAALHFPLAHPAVVAVVPGPRSAAEVADVAHWWRLEIPAALWRDLRHQGLLAPGTPTPDAATTPGGPR